VLVLPSNYIEFAVSQWSPMEWAALPCIKAGGEGTGWTSIPPARSLHECKSFIVPPKKKSLVRIHHLLWKD